MLKWVGIARGSAGMAAARANNGDQQDCDLSSVQRTWSSSRVVSSLRVVSSPVWSKSHPTWARVDVAHVVHEARIPRKAHPMKRKPAITRCHRIAGSHGLLVAGLFGWLRWCGCAEKGSLVGLPFCIPTGVGVSMLLLLDAVADGGEV